MTDNTKRTRFEQTVAGIQQRYSVRALRPARDLPLRPAVPHVSTGFAALDTLTGCGGVPLGVITLLSGKTTSGKLTLAYKVLCSFQRPPAALRQAAQNVAIIDQTYTLDGDYMARCGLDLEHALIVRPQSGRHAIDLLRDLVTEYAFAAVLLPDLPSLRADVGCNHYLDAALPRLHPLYQQHNCALLALDEPHPPWHRLLPRGHSALGHYAGLHIELQHERWAQPSGELSGYRAQARIVKSRWAPGGGSTPVEIVFNGTVHARETW